MPDPLYRAVASCHLNFYPGTLTPTPPDYRHTRHSDPMPYADAVRLLGHWRDAVTSPGCWHFSVVPDAPASPRTLAPCPACGRVLSLPPAGPAKCFGCGKEVR